MLLQLGESRTMIYLWREFLGNRIVAYNSCSNLTESALFLKKKGCHSTCKLGYRGVVC